MLHWLCATAHHVLITGCHRTVYLCDDGRDPEKAQYMAAKGAGFVYVAGRERPKGEVNGKSGNLNNVLRQLYDTSPHIPGNEVLCILDADMVSCKRVLPELPPAPSRLHELQSQDLLSCLWINAKHQCICDMEIRSAAILMRLTYKSLVHADLMMSTSASALPIA